MAAHSIDIRHKKPCASSKALTVQRWDLRDVLHSNTVIGVFDEARGAEAAVQALEAIRLDGSIWQAGGRGVATQVRAAWSHRSLLRRLLGFSQEERLVEELARHLEAGRSLVAVRAANARTSEGLLPGATQLISLGRWSYRFKQH